MTEAEKEREGFWGSVRAIIAYRTIGLAAWIYPPVLAEIVRMSARVIAAAEGEG